MVSISLLTSDFPVWLALSNVPPLFYDLLLCADDVADKVKCADVFVYAAFFPVFPICAICNSSLSLFNIPLYSIDIVLKSHTSLSYGHR